jgi:hypothetical protein
MSIAIVPKATRDYYLFEDFKALNPCFRKGSIHRIDLLLRIGLPFSYFFYSASGFIHNSGGPSHAVESRLGET